MLVYRGVEDGGKVAIFELTGDVDAQGDGTCDPDPGGLPVPEAARRRDRVHHGHRHGRPRPTPSTSSTWSRSTRRRRRPRRPTPTDGPVAGQGRVLVAEDQGSVKLRSRNRYVFDATTGTLHRAAKGAKTPVASAVTTSRREPMKCARRALGPAAAR